MGLYANRGLIFRSVLVISIILGLFNYINVGHANPTWSSPILVDSHRGIDILPSALQAANGTLWVAWQSNRNGLFTGRSDIIFKTYTNGVWSSDNNLTSTGWNSSPSLVQLPNGTILSFWSLKSGTSFIVVSSLTNGNSWSNPVQVTSTTLNDTQPSAAVGRDGTVWLVWTRVDSTCSTCTAIKQLYYKTWRGGSWSSEVKLTNDSNQNYGSNVVVSKDGMVRVTWSKGAPGSVYQLFYKTYNGTVWSPDTQIVSSPSTDERPSMVQDRNGTLWLFWGRLVVVSTLIQFYELVGKYSYDLTQTWSPEIVLTNTANTIDSEMPSAVQSAYGVKPLWVFYSSDLNVPDLDIYALQSSGISPVHDVTTAGILAYNNLGTSWEYPGGLKSVSQSAIMTVKVAIVNIGDYVENVVLTLTLTNTTLINVGTSKSLVGPGNTVNFYFYWNTTNISPARYGASFSISALPGETLGNMGDNNGFVSNAIHILPLGDVDQDGSVTITDFSVAVYGFDFTPACNCSRWNPYADVHGLGIIDIVDVGIIQHNYGIYT